MMTRQWIPLGLLATGLLLAAGASAQDDLPPAQDGERFGATMGIGAVTMNGKTWTQVALRPEIPIGKLGIALDLTLYFDEDGDIRKEDWNDPKDIIDKIYYVRWGHKGDPLYLKAGALDNVTLGYGILVRHYSNAMQYPSIRRVGAEFDVTIAGKPQFEGFLANFRELGGLGGSGLLGVRASYPVFGKLRAGASLIVDGNLYAGMADADNDGVPDQLDRFPDYNDGSEYALWHDLRTDLGEGSEIWRRLSESAGYPGDDWIDSPLKDYSGASENVQAYVADLGYELLPNLDVYAQWATFQDYGSGYGPGVRWRPFSFLEAGAEYRIWGEEFIGEFFDRSYDLERTYMLVDQNTGADSLYTKRQRLADAPAMKGWFADARASIFNIVTVYAAYNTMKPDKANIDDWNSLFADASLNLAKVPKLTELGAYYSQSGQIDLFENTASTATGVRLGYEMAPGAEMRLNWRTTYADRNGDGRIRGADERDRTFSVETVFRLR